MNPLLFCIVAVVAVTALYFVFVRKKSGNEVGSNEAK
jgi:hypothetical protein